MVMRAHPEHQQLLDQINKLQAKLVQTRAEVSAERAKPRGRIRLGAPGAASVYAVSRQTSMVKIPAVATD